MYIFLKKKSRAFGLQRLNITAPCYLFQPPLPLSPQLPCSHSPRAYAGAVLLRAYSPTLLHNSFPDFLPPWPGTKGTSSQRAPLPGGLLWPLSKTGSTPDSRPLPYFSPTCHRQLHLLSVPPLECKLHYSRDFTDSCSQAQNSVTARSAQ